MDIKETDNMELITKLNDIAQHIEYGTINPTIPVDLSAKMRDYFLTINAGSACYRDGYARYENLKDYLLATFSHLLYACWDEEIGDSGNEHIHAFISLEHGISMSSMIKKFPGAHIEPKKGSAFFARNYILKPKGLVLKGHEKSHTQTKPMKELGDFEQIKEKGIYNKDASYAAKPKIPINKRIFALVDKYDTLDEIAAADPYVHNTYRSTLQELLNQKLFKQFISNPRVERIVGKEGVFYKVNKLVYYIYGQEGCGKTFSTRLQFGGAGKVGKVTFNKGIPNFDNYHGEPVMYLNEFKGNIPLSVLQNLLEEEPTMLDARYSDKENLAITYIFDSNIPFDKLYPNVKEEEPDKYRSFVRRFTGGVWETYQTNDGVRYIALHTELLPKSKRFGDKYDPNKLECPLSEEWTGYKRVPLEKLIEIKTYEWLHVYTKKDGYECLQEGYVDYHDWIREKEAYSQLNKAEIDFLVSNTRNPKTTFEEEVTSCESTIGSSLFSEDRQALLIYAARNQLRKKYNREINAP